MAENGGKKAVEALAVALAGGQTLRAGAQSVGIGERTASRRWADPVVRLAKDRGYVERREVTGRSGRPIQSTEVRSDLDLTILSDKELEQLNAILDRATARPRANSGKCPVDGRSRDEPLTRMAWVAS